MFADASVAIEHILDTTCDVLSNDPLSTPRVSDDHDQTDSLFFALFEPRREKKSRQCLT